MCGPSTHSLIQREPVCTHLVMVDKENKRIAKMQQRGTQTNQVKFTTIELFLKGI